VISINFKEPKVVRKTAFTYKSEPKNKYAYVKSKVGMSVFVVITSTEECCRQICGCVAMTSLSSRYNERNVVAVFV
jgi:hypothetical protein